jgi:putative ABC transport system permease protein
MGPLGSMDRIYLLSGIAGFVILLACINFINLTTARSVYRAREVGLRKVAGSTRRGLIKQFLSESFVLTLFAFLLATALVGISLPLFNTLLAKQYTLSALTTVPVLAGAAMLILVIAFLSGYYPALVMSGMRPADVLKGKLQHSTKGINLRRGLVVFQFTISFGLVMGTLVILSQLNFMQRQQLGFAKDEIVVINASRATSANPDGYQTFKAQLKSLAIVDDVAFTNSVPGRAGWMGQVAYPEGKSGDAAVSVEYMAVDEDYISTLDLRVVAGSGFDPDFPAHYDDGLVLNETAVSMFGWATPTEAIGKRITSPSGYPAGEVIGVVRDYHQFGLKHRIGPMVMDYNPGSSYLYAVRYKAADTKQLVASMQELWTKHFPGNDFSFFFLDDDFERQYQAEQRLVSVFVVFAVITIMIALIGLLGLVSLMVASRTKEIGVRKVLGADVLGIAGLLSKEFVILVAVANVIAVPLVWYFATAWLENFAWRNSIDPLLFIVTFVLAIIVTSVTVSFQTIRAAMADPVQSLRYE